MTTSLRRRLRRAAEPRRSAASIRRETYEIKPGDPASRYKERRAVLRWASPSPTPAATAATTTRSMPTAAAVAGRARCSWTAPCATSTSATSATPPWSSGTARYDFTPPSPSAARPRTGFRAPTLAESFYSATNVGRPTAFVRLPPNSPAAPSWSGSIGLKAEKSTNFSARLRHPPGRAADRRPSTPTRSSIENRIVGSGSALRHRRHAVRSPAVATAAILANGNVLDPTVTFTSINIFAGPTASTTRTRGAALVVDLCLGRLRRLGPAPTGR